MNRERRKFLVVLPAAVVTACESARSPTAPAQKAQLVAPTDPRYRYEVIALDEVASVRSALEAAGLVLRTTDKGNWLTTAGQPFAGSLLTALQRSAGAPVEEAHWMVHLGDRRLCLDISRESVPAGTRVRLFPDDGVRDPDNCGVAR